MKHTYRGWFGRKARRRCPHSNLRPIYGDQVTWSGGWRLDCKDCGKFIDGPVALAEIRSELEGAVMHKERREQGVNMMAQHVADQLKDKSMELSGTMRETFETIVAAFTKSLEEKLVLLPEGMYLCLHGETRFVDDNPLKIESYSHVIAHPGHCGYLGGKTLYGPKKSVKEDDVLE